MKTFEFQVTAVYVPNSVSERRSFFRRLGLFVDNSKRLVLEDDWNAILDRKIDKGGRDACGLRRCESSLIDLLAEFDLIERFRLDHLWCEIWTWLGDLPSGQIRSYQDIVS